MKAALLLLSLALTAFARSPAPLPATCPWDVPALSAAPKFDWLEQAKPVRSLFYEGELFEGHATRVFAYYASPATLGTDLTPGKKFPAVVLVHGGGGSAFAEWAKLYAQRGYAAIAMDLAGNWQREPGQQAERRADAGPDQDDATKFRETPAPHHDQWIYHAVAAVLRAHSLIRSFPEVDPERTAVTGISWGGYLTCIVAGVDARFKAAVPQYGCGFLAANSCWTANWFNPNKPTGPWMRKWTELWDPASYVGSAVMPMLFVNGSNDFAYPLDSYMKTYALVASPKNIAIKPAMPHGHIFDVPEVLRFIDSELKGEVPLPVITQCLVENGKVSAQFETKTGLASAFLYFTSGAHVENNKRVWNTQPVFFGGGSSNVAGEVPPAQTVSWFISSEVPPAGTTTWYISIQDERGALVSSEVFFP